MTQTDLVRFLLPTSRVYQFPAMAVVQSYVNGFKQKMEANCLTSVKPEFNLMYQLVMPPKDWLFWKEQDIKLDIPPIKDGEIKHPDAVVDLTEAKAQEL